MPNIDPALLALMFQVAQQVIQYLLDRRQPPPPTPAQLTDEPTPADHAFADKALTLQRALGILRQEEMEANRGMALK